MSRQRRIYIKAAAQISVQEPLSEQWMTDPVVADAPYLRSQDPDFREWLSPMASRRMGKLLKRALVTACKVMNDSGIDQPDAIVNGTGLGCIENTEYILNQLFSEGEETVKPTPFMQSTHNSISSLIAIQHHCHGYNSTYSHKGLSFESALLDVFMQMRLGDISTALVTGNDEMTPTYFRILQRAGYIGQPGQVAASETSVALMLTTDPAGALCEITDVRLHTLPCDIMPSLQQRPDLLMLGTNGLPCNDAYYQTVADQWPEARRIDYKRWFGESCTVSGLGVYAAAHLLSKGAGRQLLFVNHSEGRNVCFINMCSVL